MGDSACLLHGFSYASAVPNESKQGNHVHVLGESISFGRFATENLSWERWSTFSHKKYVEEAERYARPGSVAQKKAFFEAHYKRIAAQRAVAALLEQENAAMAKTEELVLENDNDHEGELSLSPHSGLSNLGIRDVKLHDVKVTGDDRKRIIAETGVEGGNEVVESPVKISSLKRPDELENRGAISASESSETSQIEKPLLKQKFDDSEEVSSVMRKRNTGLSSLQTSCHHKTTRRIPATPANTMTPQLKRESNLNHSKRKANVDEKRPPSKSLRALLSLGSFKEPNFTNKRSESSGLANICSTPFKTPAPVILVLFFVLFVSLKNLQTNLDLSWQPSTESVSTYPVYQLCQVIVGLPEKTRVTKCVISFHAENRGKSCSLCFKARPLPDFYMERETPNNQAKKVHSLQRATEMAYSLLVNLLSCIVQPQPQTAVLGKSISNKKQGTISMPPPPPSPTCLAAKNQVSRNLSKKKAPNQSKFLNNESITHENASPNIQQ